MEQPQGTTQVERNVATIVRMEQAALEQRTRVDRISGAIARFCGSLPFVVMHLGLVTTWIVLNRPSSPYRFDPYPYSLLIDIVALEALLLSAFVLINQNQMAMVAERRAHLTLQIDLLAEKEMTKALSLIQEMANHLGVPGAGGDEEIRELSQPTEVERVARVLEDALPGQSTQASSSIDP